MPVIDLGSVVGPQGPQGVAGATGAQGLQGNPGPNQVTNQTSTNLIGVLQGASSKVSVKPVDSAPTANSTNLVSSGGTDKAIKGRVPVYGLGKNLLDNGYFVNPVNQRGATSGTIPNYEYTIDRWRMSYGAAGGTWSLAPAGLTITPGTNGDARMFQVPQSWSYLTGKATTLSVLTSDGVLRYGTAIKPSSGTVAYFSEGGIVGNCVSSDVRIQTVVSCTIVAAKLELGTEQTLCHNEGSAEAPVWVLNEIPDYGEELAKCQRYFVPYAEGSLCGSTYGAQILNFIVPVTRQMATDPTVGTLKVMYNGGDITSNYNQVPSYVSRAGHISVTVSSGSSRSFGTSGAYGVILQNISAEL